METRITARKNPFLQQVRKLLSSRKEREAAGLFVSDGTKLLQEAVRYWDGLDTVILSDGVEAEVPESVRVVRVPEEIMAYISPMETPQGALFLCKLPPKRPFAPKPGMLLLDGIQDPGNLGTIIRTADWYGVRHIVCSPTTADCFAPKVVQATMGALLRVEVAYVPLVEWLGEVRERDIKTYATTLDGENIHTTKLSKGGVVIMGNEGKGVSPEVQSLVSHKLFIPPYPADREGSESLNVAIATAITLENFRN